MGMDINGDSKNRNRTDITELLADEAAMSKSIERFFEKGSTGARLETTIPKTMKRDLKELTSCIITEKNGLKTSNRIIAEALNDVFAKYAKGEGGFQLSEKPLYRGEYKKQPAYTPDDK